MQMLDSSTPSTKFLKSISNSKLSHEAASRIAQLCLHYTPLNSYLFKFKKVDRANCPACGDEDESITHFLLRCPAHAHKRWPLERLAHKKRKALSLETLSGDPDFAVPLANYIEGTNRFKHNSGVMQNGACVSSSRCSPGGKAERRKERERGRDPEDSRTREETRERERRGCRCVGVDETERWRWRWRK